MKKKILFIEEGLGIGGAEKSLITILQNFDYEKYEVDLFLFDHSGQFMSLVPSNVNILSEDKDFKIFNSNRKMAFLKFIKQLKIKKAINTLEYLINAAYSNLIKKKQYIGWQYISNMFDSLNKEYDVAISFLERKTIYFNVDKVKSEKKIGFVHIDYNKIDYDYKLDDKYFAQMDKIATVSDHCKDVLEELFPQYNKKFLVIKNMISSVAIKKMAEEDVKIIKNDNETNIVTVGRLTEQKGIDNAIRVCRKLLDLNYKIKWYVVGKGGEQKNLKKLIYDFQVEDNFILLGPDINPYKYMNFADIYVQPSRFEGYGITIAEVKVLCKPIIASDIPEFREQLGDNKLGVLCKNNDELVESIIDFIDNPEKKDIFINRLKLDGNQVDNSELEKLYELL